MTETTTREFAKGGVAQSLTKNLPATQKVRPGDVMIAPPRLGYPVGALEKFGVDRSAWKALCESIFPLAKTSGAIVLALSYCRGRRLDVMKKPVHIVPMWNAALDKNVETVWPSITEHRITAQRTGCYAGKRATVFGPEKTTTFQAEKITRKGKRVSAKAQVTYPEWAQVTVLKLVQGQVCEFVGPKVYFVEFYGMQHGMNVPNERWQRAPSQMTEKCAEAGALRAAFPEELQGEPTAEEMEGRITDSVGADDDMMPTAEPQRDQFRGDQGTPRDGLVEVEDAEFEDAGTFVVPLQEEEEREPASNVGEKTNRAQEAQGSPVAASAAKPSDPRGDAPAPADVQRAEPEPAKDPEVEDEGDRLVREQAEKETIALKEAEELVQRYVAGLVEWKTVNELKDFALRAKLAIDSQPIPAIHRGRLRGAFQQKVLEQERALGAAARPARQR